MQLVKYYSIDECKNLKKVISKLSSLKSDGRIEYTIDKYIIEIDDIDLDDLEIEDLLNCLDENDVMPYIGYEGGMDDDDFSDFNDDDYDEY